MARRRSDKWSRIGNEREGQFDVGACVKIGRGKGTMCGGRGDLYVECSTKNKREDLKESLSTSGMIDFVLCIGEQAKNYVF